MRETGEYRVVAEICLPGTAAVGVITGRKAYMVIVTNCRECGQRECGGCILEGRLTTEWIFSPTPPGSHLEEPRNKFLLLSQVGRGAKVI